ncbi:phosphoesterase PA-phosphatase [Erwinia sp. OLTSP20]|uniref:acid phosphatase n=1 Tax=unclassified Erwinia TaxID=2622719 RepID=UPI000C18726B|nr:MULTISPECIES: phosphatase PAP2 family protein [unclassified Erwinia]PIJ50308.1 phosphoesterase PA-phosphatase [Erwinia sp. OAMSP11]PIJ72146.1 phosphoesterase PA-phosphatase [Erwinia sp. OLSSP12]PIJ81437.1 phosphoesterase PA-phosphatase [Erwinia sp. OLCASP19]PIJ84143.1 phosphoesterase PA-phosphatase [Erwinia sp. OLMTSP26]PIJ85842.1 phosphoesterase PA-phosphatase [Erwinia sp. OLMDSP33]
MRLLFPALAATLLVSPCLQAKTEADFSALHQIVETTTPASKSPEFVSFQADVTQRLRRALQGDAPALTLQQVKEARQNAVQADDAWLKASGFHFAKKVLKQENVALLNAFTSLPEGVLQQNLATVEKINNRASEADRHQALVDADGRAYLYFLADALGPRLGHAFLQAYDNGELNKAAALIKHTEVSIHQAKEQYHNPRPFRVAGNTIRLVNDNVIVNNDGLYQPSGGSFPSGHTNTGYTDALLLAEMLPERFVPLLNRAAKYGYSRLVMGVHYPLDLVGARMVAQRNVAIYLNDVGYRKLFNEAKQQLRRALEKACGTSIAVCALPADSGQDPYSAPQMATFYRYTMTWGLPQQPTPQTALQIPKGAEVLLEAPLPHLSAEQRRQLMVQTALANGYPLSGSSEQSFWQRLNLHDAVQQGLHAGH